MQPSRTWRMRFWSGIVVTLSVLLSFVAAPATASAAGCKANVSPATVDKTAHYYGGNEYMGPIDRLFPTGPAGKLLGGYNRLGDEIPTTGNPDTDTNTFLAKYRTPDGKHWDYPPNWGFDSHGSTRTTLTVGMEIDRFGYDGGRPSPHAVLRFGRGRYPRTISIRPAAHRRPTITSTAW